ncbi:beta-propeller fold lactonase family protein [Methanobacterium sp.]|uniref:YVTN family beta-propeller repeat protein n=1 Tax=Methanobacterium sp. TaxID=2164 RepID=UPI002632791A|nr:beta-propeller fold lactonase family protein [Methanobacterium sp.]
MKQQVKLLIASLVLAFVLCGAVSAADNVYVANQGSDTVSVINTTTPPETNTIPVGSSPSGVAVSPDGATVYVTNYFSNYVSVIDTATNNVTNNITVGNNPYGVAFNPDGTIAYVTNQGSGSVSVIDTATYNVTTTILVGSSPSGVAVSPDGTIAYVANQGSGSVSVIDTATYNVTTTILVGTGPIGVAVSPDGTTAYVTVRSSNYVSVIDTATNNVTTTILVGTGPIGVAVSPDGTTVYVANYLSNYVSVIDTATNTQTATIPVGYNPIVVAVTPNRITYSITPSAGTGGTIVPDSVETVNYGDNVTFTITPSIGYVVADVIVDGVSQGSINSYTFTNVQSNHEIAATFSTVTKQADLYINSWSSKNNPRVGEIFTITFKVGNRGPDTAKNVVLTLPLPSGVEYVDVNVDQGTTSYDPATRTITWTLDDVVVGDPYAWVQVKALNQGSFIFQPTLTTDTFDPNIESNIQVLPVNVLAKE